MHCLLIDACLLITCVSVYCVGVQKDTAVKTKIKVRSLKSYLPDPEFLSMTFTDRIWISTGGSRQRHMLHESISVSLYFGVLSNGRELLFCTMYKRKLFYLQQYMRNSAYVIHNHILPANKCVAALQVVNESSMNCRVSDLIPGSAWLYVRHWTLSSLNVATTGKYFRKGINKIQCFKIIVRV